MTPPRHRMHEGQKGSLVVGEDWQRGLRRVDGEEKSGVVAAPGTGETPTKGYSMHGHGHRGHHLAPTHCQLVRMGTTKFAYQLRRD